MTRRIPIFMLLMAFGLLGGFSLTGCNKSSKESTNAAADKVFVNGEVYTEDSAHSTAEAVAVQGGDIIYVGDRNGVAKYIGDNTEVVDMNGGMLLPGFTDSHVHIADGGNTLISLSLFDALTPKALQKKVRDYAAAHPDLPVIVGSGWELNVFPEANPDKSLLDAAVPDRPVILGAADGHNSWVNSKALEMAGITKDTPDPLNGHIERDPKTGEPSGTLREAAQDLMTKLTPPPTLEEVEKQLAAGINFENSMGYTAAIDAAITAGAPQDAYLALEDENRLTLRMLLALVPGGNYLETNVEPDKIAETVERLKKRRAAIAEHSKGLVSGNMVKIFMDGVPENFTAAMLEPYINAPMGPDFRGKLKMPEQVVRDYVTALDNAGFQVHFHAIGDRAVRVALDAIEQAETKNGTGDRRHTIAHIEIVNPTDVPRFALLGAYGNMQALWAFADEYITKLTEPFLGPERSKWIYPFGSLEKAGATMVSGSDWPVSTSNPFDAMEVAVTRKNFEDANDKPWHPEQDISVQEFLDALTIHGARLMHQEAIRGSIEIGKKADLVLIDKSPFKVKPEDLSEIKVILTMLGGKPVYRASGS